MTARWLSTLDAFERHVDAQTQLVEHGRYDDVVAFTPPAGLAPLPEDLVTRAWDLQYRANALTELARALRDDTGRRLVQASRLPTARPAVSAYVDQQA
jgi:hypothetical protein